MVAAPAAAQGRHRQQQLQLDASSRAARSVDDEQELRRPD
jgi:hypothetical protein